MNRVAGRLVLVLAVVAAPAVRADATGDDWKKLAGTWKVEAATLNGADATAALYNLAQAYRRKGDRARAAELLARVNTLNAEKRGDDPERELRQVVIRIVREGSTPAPAGTP